MGDSIFHSWRRASLARFTLSCLLLALLAPLISATAWGTLFFFNLVFAGDVETTYHQWMLMHSTDLLWGWAGVAVLGLGGEQVGVARAVNEGRGNGGRFQA